MSTDVSVFDRQKAAAFGLVLKVLQSVFGAEPSVGQVNALREDTFQEALALLGLGGNEAIACAMDQFLTDENDFQRIGEGYYRLFVSPSLEVSPWESTYVGNPQLLFQESTLDVRNFYKSLGYVADKFQQVADDRIAIELGFLSALCLRAALADEEEEGRALVADAARFADEHLARWTPIFSKSLQERDKTGYYANWAKGLEACLLVLKECA